MGERHGRQRVLAIDPTTRGCSFAVLEQGGDLVDWGSKEAVGPSKNPKTVSAVAGLIRLYQPDILAVEDCQSRGSRRCARVRRLIRRLKEDARRRKLRVALVSPQALRQACAGTPKATKHDVAVALAERFPVLASKLPPKRKTWMTEHPRMGVFDAAAMAVTALEPGGCPTVRGGP